MDIGLGQEVAESMTILEAIEIDEEYDDSMVDCYHCGAPIICAFIVAGKIFGSCIWHKYVITEELNFMQETLGQWEEFAPNIWERI